MTSYRPAATPGHKTKSSVPWTAQHHYHSAAYSMRSPSNISNWNAVNRRWFCEPNRMICHLQPSCNSSGFERWPMPDSPAWKHSPHQSKCGQHWHFSFSPGTLSKFMFRQRWMREGNETFHNFATQKERSFFTNQFCVDFNHFEWVLRMIQRILIKRH